MPPIENKRYTLVNIEYPPVDYPNAIGVAYSELKDSCEGYGDMKSFICFDAGFRAALKYVEQKFTAHNGCAIMQCYWFDQCSLAKGEYCVSGECHHYQPSTAQ